LEKPEIEPLKGVPEEPLGGFFEWLNDKQTKIQAEGQREEIEKQVREMLKNGSSGVVVREGVYLGPEGTKLPILEIMGSGPTVLAGLANGFSTGRLLPNTVGLHYEPSESFLSFYSTQDGKLNRKDIAEGMYTSGDAEKIQELAEKEKETRETGERIARQMEAAKQKNAAEEDIRKGVEIAKSSASQRESVDKGPRSQPPPAVPQDRTRDAGGRAHPDVMDRGTGLPSEGPSASGGGGADHGGGGTGTGHDGSGNGGPGKGGPRQVPIDLSPGSVITGKPDGKDGSENLMQHLFKPASFHLASFVWQPEQSNEKTSSRARSLPTLGHSMYQLDSDEWGLPSSRRWVDINKDGIEDFCRVLLPKRRSAKAILKCTLAAGRGLDERYSGESFETEISYPRTPGTWIDMNGDGVPDFCRALPTKGSSGFLSCIYMTPEGFGKEIRSLDTINLGIPAGRTWLDINGDGTGAFCSMIPMRKGGGKLSCRFLKGDSFLAPIESSWIHWRGPGFRTWLMNADGKATFCTAAGTRDQYVDCMIVTETGFKGPYRDLLKH
jgi:hypothetical protein